MKFRWQSRKCVKDHASYVIVVVLREKTTQLEMFIYTLCLKKGCHFYFCNNFGKCRPIFDNSVTVLFSDLLLRKVVLKRPPHLKSVATLPCGIGMHNCTTLQESY